ncbi:MAG: DUF2130 domain-containing protein [Chitinophagaceae bacterium]|nr:MAG: DUF2130 domain-containing protein [Chitinophagaceae bacterium]
MPSNIKCPNCGNEFEPNDAIRDEVQKELRIQMKDWQQKKTQEHEAALMQKDAELQKREKEWMQKADDEKKALQTNLEAEIRKTISSDFENKLSILSKSNLENEEKLKLARQKEMEFLQKEMHFKNKEAEMELEIQKQVSSQREQLITDIRKRESEKHQQIETEYQIKFKELEKQLEDQKKLAAEMKRKAEQGSMQLQGESMELALEEMLTVSFPFDKIEEVGKGVKGADCIQTVRNQFGAECGKIIWESKKTEHFGAEWIEKLKADMRSQNADVAVLVTQRFPKDMDQFGEKNGVWICSFAEAKAIASILRDGIIKIHKSVQSQENKGDKMAMLYNYFTSSEFAEQWKAMREGFMSLKISIQKERDAMERLWKAREKQLEKILLNATYIRGSIDGISGLESVDLNLLGYDETEE